MPDSLPPLEQFRTIVFADPALQQELRQTPDRAGFVKLVLDRAHERGCPLTTAAIEAALDAAARDWMLRWIER
jgi:hypothetical protein